MKEIEEIRSYCLNCKNSQCRIKGCPLGNCIPEFIHEVESKKAYEILCNTTILPAICGRICPHEKQCERSCIRGIKGEPVSIGAMEAYIGDLSIENNYELSIEVDERAKDKSVAVIGSGPAGLTCAAFLARKGVKVTIYEKHDKLGGLLTHGIPEFRLPRKVVEKTIEKILDLGVEAKLNQELGRDFEIEDLAKYLNKMGAKIKGAGTDKVEIIGVKKLSGISYNIMPDRIEAGTYLVAGAITGGNIKLTNVYPEHIEPIINKLEEANCKIVVEKDSVEIEAPKRVKAVDIKTMPYPGFPTDMQSLFGALLSTAKGTSIITENIFESRYKYVQELNRMGAKVNVEGRTAVIKGTKRIQGANVVATDLRGGAALIVEALAAKGVTQIDNIHYILRGYEKIEEKLKGLGAKIYIEKE